MIGEVVVQPPKFLYSMVAIPPVTPVTSPVLYCRNETALALSATPTTGNSILYYITATGGTGLTTYTPPTTAIGTVTYYASQVTANNCEGPRAAINVTIKTIPPPPTTVAQILC